MVRLDEVSTCRASGFRASVVKIDITPDKPQWLLGYDPRESTGVHDHIFLRIVAMDDGTTQFFLISSDLCLISPSVYDKVTHELNAEMGIEPLHVWWTTTHTHSAPEVGPPGLPTLFLGSRYVTERNNEEYSALVEKDVIRGVKEACAKLTPARLGVGWGMAMANINRRARDVSGPTFLGLNPDAPTDRTIGLIRLEGADGKLIALIANYAMHGTVLSGENRLISGDAPGVVAEYVEKKLGAPMLFINGAAGDLGPIYTVFPDPESGHLSQFRVLLGDRILEAYQRMGATTADVKLSLARQVVETPRKAGLGWVSDLGAYLGKTSAGETVVRLPISFLQINNDVAIWSAPVELFCEIAIKIRSLSPFPYTFYYGYGNGWLGYIPTKEEFAHGGYEPSVSPYTDLAGEDVTRTVVSHLQGIAQIGPAVSVGTQGNAEAKRTSSP